MKIQDLYKKSRASFSNLEIVKEFQDTDPTPLNKKPTNFATPNQLFPPASKTPSLLLPEATEIENIETAEKLIENVSTLLIKENPVQSLDDDDEEEDEGNDNINENEEDEQEACKYYF